jgi:hypothetical protein
LILFAFNEGGIYLILDLHLFKGVAMCAEEEELLSMKDRGGRRSITDRRQRASKKHFPERRWLRYRRSGIDRRRPFQSRLKRKLERRRAFSDDSK